MNVSLQICINTHFMDELIIHLFIYLLSERHLILDPHIESVFDYYFTVSASSYPVATHIIIISIWIWTSATQKHHVNPPYFTKYVKNRGPRKGMLILKDVYSKRASKIRPFLSDHARRPIQLQNVSSLLREQSISLNIKIIFNLNSTCKVIKMSTSNKFRLALELEMDLLHGQQSSLGQPLD